jgi:hypothetical protein
VTSTESLIEEHKQKRTELKDDLSMTIKHGELLLGCIKTVRGDDGEEVELPSSDLPCNKVTHITAVERYIQSLIICINKAYVLVRYMYAPFGI